MLNFLSNIYKLLNPQQRKHFFKLQILVLLMGVAEMVGVLSVSPFIALVSDPDIINRSGIFQEIYQLSGLLSPNDFIIYVGIASLIVLLFSALISMYTVWQLALYANKVGAELGERLYQYYLTQSWLFHTANNSAHLTQNISIETTRLTSLVLVSIMRLNARLVLVIILGSLLFVINPLVAITALIIFSLSYWVLFIVVRKSLASNSSTISTANQQRFVLMSEAFGAIKDVLLMNKQRRYISEFNQHSNSLASANGSNQALVEAPRYFMEMVTFSSIIALVLFLYISNEGHIGEVLPLLSIYALAGFKMLPAFQQMYRSVGQIKGNMSAFNAIEKELSTKRTVESKSQDKQLLSKQIELKSISFTYPGKTEAAIKDVNLKIPALKTIGLVGASGSGKSTILDIVLGLVAPNEGKVLIDGNELKFHNKVMWQNALGYVSQQIYLSDKTLLENIAFGEKKEKIDKNRVQEVINLVHLNEMVENLTAGLETVIGERGVQLSGGQKQRLGIARALYRDPDVLFFDEATSALDGITERAIMDALRDFGGKKTIFLIAHRLKTVEACDIIYVLDKGKIVDKGNYESLLNNSPLFRKMAMHS